MDNYLFARPSILEGIGRTIDLFGIMNEYNYSKNGEEADLVAIEKDIEILHSDMMSAYQGVLCGNAR